MPEWDKEEEKEKETTEEELKTEETITPEEFTDSEANREKYKRETGGRPILKGQPTKGYAGWLRENTKPEEPEKSTKKPKKDKIRSWKDSVTANIKDSPFLKDLREDLKEFIISLKTEKIEITNELLESSDDGFILVLYGPPGIGKSVFSASGVLDGYETVFLDLTNQGRRLKQFPKIWKSKNLKYEKFHEKTTGGSFDASKSFEKLDAHLIHVIYNYEPKKTIIIVDGFSKAMTRLTSYLRKDILKVGEPKRGRQNDVGYGDWYWRKLRYNQLLENLSEAADRGFRIILTAEVTEVVEVEEVKGKLKISRTGERAPNLRDDDLYAGDIEAFFRNSYDTKTKEEGPREIEIKISKVPGIIEGTILTTPKLKDLLDLHKSKKPKKLNFGD